MSLVGGVTPGAGPFLHLRSSHQTASQRQLCPAVLVGRVGGKGNAFLLGPVTADDGFTKPEKTLKLCLTLRVHELQP